MQEVVVKRHLALLRPINEPIPAASFQIVLNANRVITVDQKALGELDKEVLRRFASFDRDSKHAQRLCYRCGALLCKRAT